MSNEEVLHVDFTSKPSAVGVVAELASFNSMFIALCIPFAQHPLTSTFRNPAARHNPGSSRQSGSFAQVPSLQLFGPSMCCQ